MNKRERYIKYKAEGKCPNCLKPTGQFAYCDDCRAKIRERQRSVEKRCIDCNVLMPYTGYFRGQRCKGCGEKRDKKVVSDWFKNLPPERQEEVRRQRTEFFKKKRANNPEWYANRWLKQKYGITFLEFKRMYEEQDGKCGICSMALPSNLLDTNDRKMINVDHDHKTNLVRGLLCPKCNRALGLFRDSIDVLKSAIEYLMHKQ